MYVNTNWQILFKTELETGVRVLRAYIKSLGLIVHRTMPNLRHISSKLKGAVKECLSFLVGYIIAKLEFNIRTAIPYRELVCCPGGLINFM